MATKKTVVQRSGKAKGNLEPKGEGGTGSVIAPRKHLKGKAVVHSSKISFQGKVFSVTTEDVTEPGGVRGMRDVIRHNGSIVVLAVNSSVNPGDPMILLERQYRHAVGRFLMELPAGRIEPGEAPLAAAKRELMEETGYRAKKWSRLVQYYASPGFLSEYFHVFLAEDLRAGEAQPEEDEKIEIVHVPLSELLTEIEAGKVHDGKTVLSALLFERKFNSTHNKMGKSKSLSADEQKPPRGMTTT